MKSFMNTLTALNIIIQSFFNLAMPIGLTILVSWFLHRRVELAAWISVLLILLGVCFGLYSMIHFVLTAMKNLERLEKEQKERSRRK